VKKEKKVKEIDGRKDGRKESEGRNMYIYIHII
jgi:hypothetical protein